MARRKKGNPIHGWLVIDKPAGMGSTQVVSKAKWLVKPQKIGHAGTLDPMATGILPLALGEATKTVAYGMDADKDYDFTITFGVETDSLDADGAITRRDGRIPHVDEINTVLSGFLGVSEQLPPTYSALKINGQRAYDLARAGADVQLKPRPVRIDSLICHGMAGASADFSVTCGKGTYVRALARDIAEKLGTFGHLTRLRRTRVGPFGLDRSISLEKLAETGIDAPADPVLLPLETVLDDIPAYATRDSAAARIRQGQTISFDDLTPLPDAADLPAAGETAEQSAPKLILLMIDDHALALAEIRASQIQPVRVFQI